MTEIGAYEAKTHLSELLGRVAKGEKIVITKHGAPIAFLLPAGQKASTPAETIVAIKRLRKGIKTKGIHIRDLIQDGRR